MNSAAKGLLLLLFAYACWLGMMAVHELGHVAHAVASGGGIERVVIPIAGYSRTDVRPNPAPRFVAWGGLIWGTALPVGACVILRRLRGRKLGQFFAGFCLIANGVYVGIGWTMTAGDAADLRALGTPAWLMSALGFVCVALGLWLWHRLGPGLGLRFKTSTDART